MDARRRDWGFSGPLMAVLAHVPCCLPPILVALGGGVASLSWLHALEPFRMWFIGFSLLQVVAMYVWAARSEGFRRGVRFRQANLSLALVVGITLLGLLIHPFHAH